MPNFEVHNASGIKVAVTPPTGEAGIVIDDNAKLIADHMVATDTALDGKADSSHVHAISDTTGLQTALDGKAAVGHSHAISDTTGLQSAIDGKVNASTYNAHVAEGASTAVHGATASNVVSTIMARNVSGNSSLNTLTAAVSVQSPLTYHPSGAYELNDSIARVPSLSVDQNLIYDTAAYRLISSRIATTSTAETLYNLDVTGGTHGWIEAVVTGWNGTDETTSYLLRRWSITVDQNGNIVHQQTVNSTTEDPSTWGVNMVLDYSTSPDTLQVIWQQPDGDNANLSYVIQHKFDYLGSVNVGGY